MLKSKYNLVEVYRIVFYIIVITLSISPAFLTSQEDGRNFLLIGCMCLGPLVYVFSMNRTFEIDKEILWFVVGFFLISIVFNFHSIRWSSLMFTCMFLFYFLAAVHCANKGKVELNGICRICEKIVYAYCLVLIIQQFCVALGLPVFNANNLTIDEPWKLNALSAEPSHTSRYVGVLMFSYLVCKNRVKGKRIKFLESFCENKMIWFSFLWVMLTTVSGTAVIVVGLIMTLYLTKRNATIFIGLILITIVFGMSSDITALKRSTGFLSAVISGNLDSMIEADHSASVRVVPWILCLQRLNVFSLRSWVGEGAGSTSLWMSDYMPGVEFGWTGGGIANFMVEYGLIVGLFYLIFSFRCCYNPNYKICSIGLWIICIVLLGINMQIAWLCMLMLYLDKNIGVRYEDKSVLRFA